MPTRLRVASHQPIATHSEAYLSHLMYPMHACNTNLAGPWIIHGSALNHASLIPPTILPECSGNCSDICYATALLLCDLNFAPTFPSSLVKHYAACPFVHPHPPLLHSIGEAPSPPLPPILLWKYSNSSTDRTKSFPCSPPALRPLYSSP